MRDINLDLLAQLMAGELRPMACIDMLIDTVHYRYTECDVPITIGSDRYEPRGMKLPTIQYSSTNIVDSAQIEVDDINKQLKTIFVDGTPQGSEVIEYLVVLDAYYQIIGEPAILFSGTIDAWDANELRVSVTIASELVQWSQKTLAKHSASCRWKVFRTDNGGIECAYAGSEVWCDRTFARCLALSNPDNFGGFRWLPSLDKKEIWWGRTRAV